MIKNKKNFQVSDNLITAWTDYQIQIYTFQGSVFHPGLCCWYGSWVHDSFQGLENKC